MSTDELISALPRYIEHQGVENDMLFLTIRPQAYGDWWYVEYELASGVQKNHQYVANGKSVAEAAQKIGQAEGAREVN